MAPTCRLWPSAVRMSKAGMTKSPAVAASRTAAAAHCQIRFIAAPPSLRAVRGDDPAIDTAFARAILLRPVLGKAARFGVVVPGKNAVLAHRHGDAGVGVAHHHRAVGGMPAAGGKRRGLGALRIGVTMDAAPGPRGRAVGDDAVARAVARRLALALAEGFHAGT